MPLAKFAVNDSRTTQANIVVSASHPKAELNSESIFVQFVRLSAVISNVRRNTLVKSSRGSLCACLFSCPTIPSISIGRPAKSMEAGARFALFRQPAYLFVSGKSLKHCTWQPSTGCVTSGPIKSEIGIAGV